MASQLSDNSILDRFRRDKAFCQVQKRFTIRKLALHDQLQDPKSRIEEVFFPLSGMISTVAQMEDGPSVEVACVGCEGVVNWQALLGVTESAFEHMGQIPGSVAAIEPRYLLPFASHPAIARYIAAHCNEVGRTAACNSLHSAEERLARWLLLASDKSRSNDLPLTQEFMAMMLGSRRSTVTIAAGHLQVAGLIEYKRGKVQIVDRSKLISAACECYVRVGGAR